MNKIFGAMGRKGQSEARTQLHRTEIKNPQSLCNGPQSTQNNTVKKQTPVENKNGGSFPARSN
jgi:hypothetical protein